MTAPERVQIALTPRELELTAAAIGMMADLMAGGDREKELWPLFDKVIAQAKAQIDEPFWAQQGAGDATVDEDALHIWDGEDD